jgi:hypothetical protein
MPVGDAVLRGCPMAFSPSREYASTGFRRQRADAERLGWIIEDLTDAEKLGELRLLAFAAWRPTPSKPPGLLESYQREALTPKLYNVVLMVLEYPVNSPLPRISCSPTYGTTPRGPRSSMTSRIVCTIRWRDIGVKKYMRMRLMLALHWIMEDGR